MTKPSSRPHFSKLTNLGSFTAFQGTRYRDNQLPFVSCEDIHVDFLSRQIRRPHVVRTRSTMSRRAVKGEYIETDTGNKVSRKATLVGTQNIILGGKSVIQQDVMIRGDLVRSLPASASSGSGSSSTSASGNTAISIGRYCFLSRGCCLRPPGRLWKGVFSHMPLRMGDHVFVGAGTTVMAASIGSHVHLGANVVVGDFAIIKDYVRVLDGTVIPPNMVIASFSIVAGQPARVVGELPEGGTEAFELRELYKTVGNNPQPMQV